MLEKVGATQADQPGKFKVTRVAGKNAVPGLVGVVPYVGDFGSLSVVPTTVLDGGGPCPTEGIVWCILTEALSARWPCPDVRRLGGQPCSHCVILSLPGLWQPPL